MERNTRKQVWMRYCHSWSQILIAIFVNQNIQYLLFTLYRATAELSTQQIINQV